MDRILEGIPRVICYIDDIIITGVSDTEHLETLRKVFQRLEEHGVCLNSSASYSKFRFLTKSVDYVRTLVTGWMHAEGIHALSDKLNSVKNARVLQNVAELRSFLRLMNYYRKSLPNVATILNPLNELLQARRRWV